MNATTIVGRVPLRFLVVIMLAAAILLSSRTDAAALVVQIEYVNFNDGPADFGGPTHLAGGPSDDGVVTWSYNTGTGQVVATGRVQGTLYWDDLFSSGCTRLTISFRNQSDSNLAVRIRDVCGPGGNANDSRNKLAIDETFSSSSLTRIRIQTARISAGPAAGDAGTSFAPLSRVYEPFFSAGFARCGYQYAGVRCQVAFSRDNGMMSGSVAGPFFVVDNKSGVCARAVVTFRTEENVVLSTRDRETCAESFLAESYDSGSLARIRVHVGEVDDFADAQLKTYSFNGNTGNFLAESGNPRVAVHERVNYVFNWTVPEPLNWHDLASVELRIRDEEETILHVRFDEATGSFSVFNEASERFGNAFAAGSQVRLQSRHAVLHLDGTSVSAVNSLLGNGPASPTVRLNLGLSFKPSAAGRTFNVYVAASDDSGDEDPFALAGTLTVED